VIGAALVAVIGGGKEVDVALGVEVAVSVVGVFA